MIAAGRVFVADVDAHTVCALNADNGSVQWSYTVGGRVDSPPTWHNGRLLFGARDGWVYCLRASSALDGKNLMQYTLNAAPEWDSMAAVKGRLFLSTTDGRVHCFAEKGEN